MARVLTRGRTIDAEILQLHHLKSDNKSIEATASNLPITIGTKTYQIDEEGNLVIKSSVSAIKFAFSLSIGVIGFIALVLFLMSIYLPNGQGTNNSLSNPAFWVGAIIATLGVFQPWSKTTLTKQGLVIWQPRDKYPPDKITAVKVKKETWHDYCVIIESDLEKRKVSGTLYIEQAEQVQKLIQDFLDLNKAAKE